MHARAVISGQKLCIVLIAFFFATTSAIGREASSGMETYGSFLHSPKIPNALFLFDKISDGDSFDLRKALRNEKIDTIVLASPGGSVSEALQLSGIINDNKIKTYIPKNSLMGEGTCASACAFLFFAGQARVTQGRLGVHQFYSTNAEQRQQVGKVEASTMYVASEIIGFLNSYNTPAFVFERMFQQTDMYFFTDAELEELEILPSQQSLQDFENIEKLINMIRTESIFEVKYFLGNATVTGQVIERTKLDGRLIDSAEFNITSNIMPPLYSKAFSANYTSFSVELVKGLTSWQVVQGLKEIDLLDGEVLDIPQEGGLAPGIYEIYAGDTRADLLHRMAIAQMAILDAAWQTRMPGLPFASKEEALILASIVEKEIASAPNHRLIASVLINRLNRGMRLQTDPTVIYGITQGQGNLRRGLRQSELRRETAWNTYVISGLPLTPIANPGRASIEAALNPDQTDFVFFVSDGTGGHMFAQTLAEHNENVAKWRQIWEKKRAKNR